MKWLGWIMVWGLGMLPDALSAAAGGPEAVVVELYAAQASGKGPFFEPKDRRRVDRYLAKPLADWVWKDAVSSQGEVGVLDFDPLYHSQDPAPKNFKIHAAKLTGETTAVVPVTFEQFGKPANFRFQLELTAAGWRVADIQYAPNSRLSDAFKDFR